MERVDIFVSQHFVGVLNDDVEPLHIRVSHSVFIKSREYDNVIVLINDAILVSIDSYHQGNDNVIESSSALPKLVSISAWVNVPRMTRVNFSQITCQVSPDYLDKAIEVYILNSPGLVVNQTLPINLGLGNFAQIKVDQIFVGNTSVEFAANPTHGIQFTVQNACARCNSQIITGRCKQCQVAYCGKACHEQDWPSHQMFCNN